MRNTWLGRLLWRPSTLDKLRLGVCPNCGDRHSIVAGPQGGASRNWYCTSCLHGWNVKGYLDGPNLGVDALGLIEIELVAQYMVRNKGRATT